MLKAYEGRAAATDLIKTNLLAWERVLAPQPSILLRTDCNKIKYSQVYESCTVKCAYKCEVDPQGICVCVKTNFSNLIVLF